MNLISGRRYNHLLQVIIWTLIIAVGQIGCGTFIGNPSGPVAANNPDTGDTLTLEALLKFDSSLVDCSLGNEPFVNFNNTAFSYTMPIPSSWTIDLNALDDLQLTNSLESRPSSIHILANTLSTPIDDLLSYLQSTQPTESWQTQITASNQTLVLNKKIVVNSDLSSVYQLFFFKQQLLIQMEVVINTKESGDTLASCAINNFQFTGNDL
jgi:hypothetical protein